MAIQMTNRLLALVIAMALTSGVVAHAAQTSSPRLVLPALTLPAHTLPEVLRSASIKAQSVFDRRGALEAAYRRDHEALEQLRRDGTSLRGAADPAFNQLIGRDEAGLAAIERAALATASTDPLTAIAKMDKLVADARAALAAAQPGAQKTHGLGGQNTSRSGSDKQGD